MGKSVHELGQTHPSMTLIYHLRPATPNIGNDLIVMALQDLIAESTAFPADIINLPAKGTSAVIKVGGIVRQTVNDIHQFGAKVIIGPGNLFENNGLEVESVALDSLREAPLIFSVSWGRIYDDRGALHPRTDAMGQTIAAALCQKSRKVLVRDHSTKRFVEGLGVHHVEVIGCPVLTLQPARLHLPPPDPRTTDAAIVSIRNPLLMNISPRLQGRVHQDVRRIIDGLTQMGHRKIVLLCHDLRDIRFAAAYPDVSFLYTENPLQYLGWLRDSSLNVTFRLHSLLPCAVLGKPVVHFTYDERAKGLIEVAGLQQADVHYVLGEDPVQQALALCADTDALLKATEVARPTWKSLEQRMRDDLSSWLAQS